MNTFMRFVASPKSLSEDLVVENADLEKELEDYKRTVPEKKNLAHAWPINTNRFLELIKTGLSDIEIDENDSEEILKDLRSLEHDTRIKRVHRLQYALDYAETKYKYVYGLLEKIHSLLKNEFYLIKAIEKESSEELAKHLQNQVDLEVVVIKKIDELEDNHGLGTFARLFGDLARGEAIIEELDRLGKKHFAQMQGMFGNEIPESVTYQWVQGVLDSIDNRIEESIENGSLTLHPDIVLEFINSQKFVDLVTEVIIKLKPRISEARPQGGVSDRMIQIFVKDFRRGFNERVD